MMVSHIDDDHVVGLVDFTGAWREAVEADRPWPYPVREVWHNSFERVSNAKDLNAVKASVTASAGAASIEEVDLDEAGIEDTEERRDALKVLASVTKGKRLRDDLDALGVPSNTGFEGHLVRPGQGPSVPYKLGPELELHIVAPLPEQLDCAAEGVRQGAEARCGARRLHRRLSAEPVEHRRGGEIQGKDDPAHRRRARGLSARRAEAGGEARRQRQAPRRRIQAAASRLRPEHRHRLLPGRHCGPLCRLGRRDLRQSRPAYAGDADRGPRQGTRTM